MSFVSNMWDGTFEEAAFTQGESYLVETWLGWDSDIPVIYILHVNLHPSEEGTEFVFCLVIKNRVTGDEHATFDSDEAAQFIPKQYRHKVLERLLQIAERVIRSCNRDTFFMVTFLPNLPPKALVKYDRLCQVFGRCGYNCLHTEPVPGRHFWRMNRREC